MHFDDRLATVLRHRATGERAARTQYRQLLDLLGEARDDGDRSLLVSAWLRLGALGEKIPAAERAEIVREHGNRIRNPQLAAHLAEDEPAVAAAALGTARMPESDWTALIPRLPVRARGFLRFRNDLPGGAVQLLDRLGVSDRALPLPQVDEPLVLTEEITPEPEKIGRHGDAVVMPFPANDSADAPPNEDIAGDAVDTPAETEAVSARARDNEPRPASEPGTIAALVERIEAFKRSRNETRDADPGDNGSAPPLPFVELQDAQRPEGEDGLIFTTDGEGRIDWTEDRVAPMLRYLRLSDCLDRVQQLRLQQHLPLSAVPVTLEGAAQIAGDWYCDAAPRFDPIGGRFVGYAGRLRRAAEDDGALDDPASDRIRQLLHELRTPVNAIQGFAEVIQQQLFGPVPHEYRALAAGIAGDSARMLAGFDELDRLAKLESGLREMHTGEADMSAIVTGQLGQLAAILKSRNAGFAVKLAEGCTIALAQAEAETLSWRILAALAGAIAPSETVRVKLSMYPDKGHDAMRLECELPASLAERDDIFAAENQKAGSAGMLTPGSFGTGFALRLARAEARSIGGEMERIEDKLVLSLPLLTESEAADSAAMGAEDTARPGVS
ncbi:sensor histidine kinase [Qipengyuania sp. CAU 1752]